MYHILDRENRVFVADLNTLAEAEQRLSELLEANPDADLFIFSTGDDDPFEPVISEQIVYPETAVLGQPEPELRDQIGRVRDTET